MKKIIVHLMEQGTEEWFAIKAGKVSASHITDVLAGGKGITRDKYMAKLIVERLTGVTAASFSSAAMEHGIETEPEARENYEFRNDVEVKQVGFVEHAVLDQTGCSPDGFVDTDGQVEIKCPESHTHLATLLSGVVEPKYIKQINFQLACTGRKWCDFISFDNRFPEKHKLFVKRVERDEDMIKDMTNGVLLFNAELIAKIEKLEGRNA